MEFIKANDAYRFIKEIKDVENKIRRISEFNNHLIVNYDIGEISLRTTDGKIYSISVDESHELRAIVNLILDYYDNRKKSLLKIIKEL